MISSKLKTEKFKYYRALKFLCGLFLPPDIYIEDFCVMFTSANTHMQFPSYYFVRIKRNNYGQFT